MLFNLVTLLVSVTIAAFLGEAGLRLFFRKELALPDDERSLMYRYDKTLGWFPIANRQAYLLGSRAFGVTNNSEGFRASERTASNKPGIIFLGDSFVWGYDVEAAEQEAIVEQGHRAGRPRSRRARWSERRGTDCRC